MVIRREGPSEGFGLKTNIIRCDVCRKKVTVVMIRSYDQKSVCKDCAGSKWAGFEVPERAATPDTD